MAAGYARKPGLLRSAFKHLFSARKSDWEKFDGMFDAFWLGKRVRSRSMTTGSAKAANNPSLKSLQVSRAARWRRGGDGQIPSADDGGRRSQPAKAAWRARRAPKISPRRISASSPIPSRSSEAHAVAARLARAMRARLTRRDLARRRGYRLDLRRTIHRNISHGGVPISLVGGSARKSRCGS